jgi:hypothetical protein
VLALDSVAEQLTFARPMKKLPERRAQETGTIPSTASVARTKK